MIILLYALLSAAMFYLGSRAKITEALWTLYPHGLARFMDCAACTGFWWGVIWHVVIGARFEIDLGPLPAEHIATPLVVGLCTLVLTPIVAAVMHYGLMVLGSAVPAEDDAEAEDGEDVEDAEDVVEAPASILAAHTQIYGTPARPKPIERPATQALRKKLETLTGDQMLDVIEACLAFTPSIDAMANDNLRSWGLTGRDVLEVRAWIETYAQTKLIDGNAWRGRLPRE